MLPQWSYRAGLLSRTPVTIGSVAGQMIGQMVLWGLAAAMTRPSKRSQSSPFADACLAGQFVFSSGGLEAGEYFLFLDCKGKDSYCGDWDAIDGKNVPTEEDPRDEYALSEAESAPGLSAVHLEISGRPQYLSTGECPRL